MGSGKFFSCCIIGQGKLTLDCAQQLLDIGHKIFGIVSDNMDVREWAVKHDIPNINTAEDQQAFLEQWEFDFLFSIINPNKVPDAVLKLPKKMAINFHDAPLPRYAGLHVTSWAIANREQSFGVTWHEMTEQFDAGKILKQIEFPIDSDETAFSLNVKCFQKGSETFTELIDELADGRETRKPQDLNQRSSYLASKRPNAAAIIDWSLSAEELEAQVRAFSFQPDPNPIGMPKVLIAGHYYLVAEVEIKAQVESTAPGTICSLSRNSIDVVTGSSVIALKSLMTIDAAPIEADQLLARHDLHIGDVLASLSEAERKNIDDVDHRFGRKEKYWQDRLSHSEPFLFTQQIKNPQASECYKIISSEFLNSSVEQVAVTFPDMDFSDFVIAAYYCFLRRIGDLEFFDLGIDNADGVEVSFDLSKLFATRVPFSASIDTAQSMRLIIGEITESLCVMRKNGLYALDLYARNPAIARPELSVSISLFESSFSDDALPGDALNLAVQKNSNQYQWRYNSELLSGDNVSLITESFKIFIKNVIEDFELSLANIVMISEQENHQLLNEWNQTQKPYDNDHCIHQLFEEQALQRPDAIALVCRNIEITYFELELRANKVALRLQAEGAQPDMPIGIFIDRSIDMMVGLLGILKSGAAYVPLDPAYPRDRIALMIDDANLSILLTHSNLQAELPVNSAKVVCVDQLLSDASLAESVHQLECSVGPANLAYVIYTSGSTGRPKGVMIEHRNVMNFFTGMDDTLNYQGSPGVWLAVTSISFDISVLEIFWTLSRGFKVVIQEEDARTLAQDAVSTVQRKLNVGLFYFSSDAGPSSNNNRYKLLIDGAKFADANGFSCIWTPERHFHLFGGLYPNPSVTSAAIAAVTSTIAIRAGSIVLPLHNPVRVVEEWSVVDNISGGRVGFSFASGWHANDFSLLPENYENRKQIMYDNIEKVRELWAGNEITMTNGQGEPFTARVYPAPIQEEPPIWITTAGNVDSFRQAGEGGFNILTNLLGQSIEEIKEKIVAYREGRRKNGHQGDGNVSVMVHTFVGADVEEVREIVREPFCQYLKTSFDLVKIAPWAFPAFRQPSKSAAQDPSFDADALTEEDLDALLDHAFDRYFETAGIFGTPASCLPLIDQLKSAGVDEIACLVDFGVDDDLVLDSLTQLNKLRELSNPQADSPDKMKGQDFSVAAQIQKHKVTHFQCTPSMARILSADPATFTAMCSLQKVLLGGEALPIDLAGLLKQSLSGDLINVYGPTETTIWSTSSPVPDDPRELSIGRPIANTDIYVLDSALQLSPIGVPGELCIGGAGVVRGYLDRPELTAERFISNDFNDDADARIYRTGDLVKYRKNGDIEYLGRLDHQVKLRGYRIELGEIESLICANNAVKDCVVTVPDVEDGAQGLVAYIVSCPTEKGVLPTTGTNTSTDYWQTIWNETYQAGTYTQGGEQEVAGDDPTLNISGWLNSYTGEQHPKEDMFEWVTASVERILALKPKRVLEIGCGTGMILYRVAQHCETYVGVDFSEHALASIQQQLTTLAWNNVQLVQGEADSFSLVDAEPFDLIIINSVVQYFPSADYLLKVLKSLFTLMADNGRVFVGDVRSLPLMESFHHSLELTKAPASMSLAGLQNRIKEHRENESELVIDADFFLSLEKEIPEITHVDVQLKRGTHHNEMSMFRYDVCLGTGEVGDVLSDADFNVLVAEESLSAVKDCLEKQSSCFVMRDIINSRVDGHIYAHKLMESSGSIATVSDLHAEIERRGIMGIDPEQVYQLDSSWSIQLSWAKSGKIDCYDAYFIPSVNHAKLSLAVVKQHDNLSDYTFEPIPHSDDYLLAEKLKELLREQLPEFMVPSEYMVLKALPLTPNGKIDRKALPKPDKRRRDVKEAFVEPEGDIEQTIASVLQEMLNLEKIGTRDNFTDIGANSLLIVQANNRLSQRLDRKVSLVSMYRYPTIASLAEHLSGNADSKQGMDKGQKRGEKRKLAQANRKKRLASRRR